MEKVIGEFKPATKHKSQNIAYDSIGQVAYDDQSQRKLDVLRVENLAELPVQKAYVHQQQRVKAQEAAEKDIAEKPAEETDQQPLPLPPHEPEGGGQYDHKVRYDARKAQAVKDAALQDKA